MRNVFDQFKKPENKLTHALMTCLNEDHELLRGFVTWATGSRPPNTRLIVQEQSLPGGYEEAEDSEEAEKRGLPDGCIHDGKSWALAIESKIALNLEAGQLRIHRSTIERCDFTDVRLLALVVKEPAHCVVEGLKIKKWADLYKWLSTRTNSEWANRLRSYMEVLEAKLPKEEYLKEGTLTVFSGIPFNKETPYNYRDAKRVIRLLMDELLTNKLVKDDLGVGPAAKGRKAITGRDSNAVWDYLPIGAATEANTFTEYPHLTVGIHADFVQALVTMPNAVRTSFRRALIDGGQEVFCELFRNALDRYWGVFKNEAGVSPIVEAVQRRYPSQRSEPFIDARIDFDLRTAFEVSFDSEASPKHQPQWLLAVFEALSQKRSNLQLAVGTRFHYNLCSTTQHAEIAQRISESWVVFNPIIEKMLSAA